MKAAHNPARTRRSPLEKLLAGPPPTPRASWHFTVILDGHGGAPPWPTKVHKRNGVEVRYMGVCTWSTSHHAYRVFPRQDMKRATGNDPIALVLALAPRLKVSAYQVHCALGHLTFTRTPNGLCQHCWVEGRRRAGQPHTWARESQTGLMDLCPEHVWRGGESGAVVLRA
jgi:hypothetical protein